MKHFRDHLQQTWNTLNQELAQNSTDFIFNRIRYKKVKHWICKYIKSNIYISQSPLEYAAVWQNIFILFQQLKYNNNIYKYIFPSSSYSDLIR